MTHGNSGRTQSSEHVRKRVEAIRASGVYARLGAANSARNKARAGSFQSAETKAKISVAMRGKKNSLGVKRPPEFKKRLSEYWKDNPDHNHWIDGKGFERSSERVREMGRLEYRTWRTSVFERDGYACVHCAAHGVELHADHIKPYSTHPELRLAIGNGRTLCVPCHIKTDTYGSKAWR